MSSRKEPHREFIRPAVARSASWKAAASHRSGGTSPIVSRPSRSSVHSSEGVDAWENLQDSPTTAIASAESDGISSMEIVVWCTIFPFCDPGSGVADCAAHAQKALRR